MKPTAHRTSLTVEITLGMRSYFARAGDRRFESGSLEEVINELAAEGYDFFGKIDEFNPTGSIAMPSKTYLFVK